MWQRAALTVPSRLTISHGSPDLPHRDARCVAHAGVADAADAGDDDRRLQSLLARDLFDGAQQVVAPPQSPADCFHRKKPLSFPLRAALPPWYNGATNSQGGYFIMQTIQPGRYRHFKGGEYRVLGTARHSETLEEMVVYQALYGERGLWVRPAAMWNEHVERDGYSGPRFTYIGQ